MDPEGEGAEALFLLARVSEERGEAEKGRPYLERLVRDFPDSDWADDALYRLAGILEEERGCGEALPLYERLREEYSRSGWASAARSAVARCRRSLAEEKELQ